MKKQSISIHGLTNQFYFWGNPRNPKLFLFHGWLDTGASFHFVCQHLSKYFYCIAPDLRGYGKSEHTRNPLGYFFYEYVADAKAIFDFFSPNEKVRILGHSLGGAVVSLYAGIYPERVSHLINVEGFGFRNEPPSRGPLRARKWMEQLKDGRRFRIHSSLKKFAERLQISNPRLSHTVAFFLARHLSKKVRGGYVMAADPKHKFIEPYLFPLHHFYAFWKRIQARCLLVVATETEFGRKLGIVSFRKELKKRLKNFPAASRLVFLDGCGHMMHQENPEGLARQILSFLPSSKKRH